ncbi:GerAB/ArcD/ProY family transporter [Paenibacillus aceris]|uniref:Spore germination protein KB n=1 Tax=Paenibacillus aceris TaxID=869555 RepID=A0ABS4I0U5_9BACL|nr:GerAB/ArcD/ProY family transporter [Paenibacillus aceris]MBP1964537.1 spore germination protein KB [Paenibacillus aceris]NHW35753.1 GerAB/ArcD/ProY family transporter [Paenibacillus aceris]
MENLKLKPTQLFLIMLLFEIGTPVVFNPGLSARKDAWMVPLLSMLIASVLYYIYIRMFKQRTDVTLIGYIRLVIGKQAGSLLGFMYVIYFLYLASRNIRDYSELLADTILDNTPLFIISSSMLVTISYVLWLGLTTLARMAQIFIFLNLFMLILMALFIILSGVIQTENLFPVLEEGWKPVISAIPSAYNFPFAEMIVFTMFFPYLAKPQSALKIGLTAMWVTGIILSIILVFDIWVLGPNMAARSNFPLLTVVRMINIADFIQRLDPLLILTLIVGVFFKVSIYFYAGMIGAAELFHIGNHRRLIAPVAVVILYSSLIVSENMADHLKEGLKILPVQVHPYLRIAIPLMLLIIGSFRKLSLQREGERNGKQ